MAAPWRLSRPPPHPPAVPVIRYTYDYEAATVVEVECAEVGYPHRDANGDKQYNNSHFDTAEEAWIMLLREAEAGVSLAVRDYRHAKEQLAESERHAAEAAEKLCAVKANHEKRKAAP